MIMPRLVVAAGCKAVRARRRRGLHDAPASKWKKPEQGRLKLNFDGSYLPMSESASIGGVYRDDKGKFVLGYAERIGKKTSSVAELAALRRGLQLAQQNGFGKIAIEGDFKTAVDAIKKRARIKSKEDSLLFEEIATLLKQLKCKSVAHILRKGNKVADGFAKLGHREAAQRVWRKEPPKEVLAHLQQDAKGK